MLVFDASTLILIARIELIEVFLARISRKVLIPSEVERECCGAVRTFDALMIERAIQSSHIKVLEVDDRKLLARLRRDFALGAGEAEAIALAISEKAHFVATDDKRAINACKLLKLPFITAPNILVHCREKGWIGRDDSLRKFERLVSYGRYSNSIVEDAKARLGVAK